MREKKGRSRGSMKSVLLTNQEASAQANFTPIARHPVVGQKRNHGFGRMIGKNSFDYCSVIQCSA
jgi:hypothetical protein